MKVNVPAVLGALRELNATEENSAVSYFDLATVLRIDPHDSDAVDNMKKQCGIARDSREIFMFLGKPPKPKIAMLYIRS